MKYQDLVESVRDHAGLDSAEQAREAVSAVLSTLAHGLRPAERHQLAEQLPGAFDSAVEVPGPPEIRHGSGVVLEIAQRLTVSPERARYLGQAVIRALRTGDPETVDTLKSTLSSDALDVLASAGQAPQQAASVRPEVPTELSDRDVDQALRQLTGWRGDRHGISRTVQLPPDRLTPLVNQVQRVARAFNDHAQVERDGDTITFTLRTGRPGVVTEPDVRLAEQIDRVVAEIGSGGRPGS